LKQQNIKLDALLLRDVRELKIGQKIDIIFTIHKNIFNNRVKIQLILDEIKV